MVFCGVAWVWLVLLQHQKVKRVSTAKLFNYLTDQESQLNCIDQCYAQKIMSILATQNSAPTDSSNWVCHRQSTHIKRRLLIGHGIGNRYIFTTLGAAVDSATTQPTTSVHRCKLLTSNDCHAHSSSDRGDQGVSNTDFHSVPSGHLLLVNRMICFQIWHYSYITSCCMGYLSFSTWRD